MEIRIDIKNGEIIEYKGFFFDDGALVCDKDFEGKILNIDYDEFEEKIEELIKHCDNVEYWVSKRTLYIDKVNKLTEAELKQAFECLVKTYKQVKKYLANVEFVEEI